MGSWLTGAIVFGIVALAARTVYRDRQKGKCSGCSGCGTKENRPACGGR